MAEVVLVLRATAVRREREFENARILQHEMSGLMAIGFHDPKKMPEYKPLAARPAGQKIATALDDENARGFLMRLALRSKQS